MQTLISHDDLASRSHHDLESHAFENLGDFTATPHVLLMTLLSVGIGVIGAYVALALLILIRGFTTLFFFQRIGIQPVSPAAHAIGAVVIAIPVLGGLIVGLMA